MQQQYAEVEELIARRRREVMAIAEELIKRDELNSQDVEEILQRVREQDQAMDIDRPHVAVAQPEGQALQEDTTSSVDPSAQDMRL